MIIEPSWFLIGLLAPLAISLAGVGLLSRAKDARGSCRAAFGWWLGLGLAITAAFFANTGLPPWKPIESTHWLVMAVLPAAVVLAALSLWSKCPRVLMYLLRLIIAAGIAPLLLQSYLKYTWSTAEAVSWLAGLGLATFVIWVLVHRYVARFGGRAALFALGATMAGLAACTVASGSVTAGLLAGSVAVALGGSYLATISSKSPTTPGPVMSDLAVPMLLGLLINNWMYSWQMQHEPWAPRGVAALLAIAPIGLWIGRLPLFSRYSDRTRALIGCGVALALIGLALGVSGYEAYLRSQAPTGDYYY